MAPPTRLHINVAAAPAARALEQRGWTPYTALDLPDAPDGSQLSEDDTELATELAWKLREQARADFGVEILRHPYLRRRSENYTRALENPDFADEVNHAFQTWLGEQATWHQAADPRVVTLSTPRTLSDNVETFLDTFAVEGGTGRWTLILPRQVVGNVLSWFNRSSGNLGTEGPDVRHLFSSEEVAETTFGLWEPGNGTPLASFQTAREAAEALHA